MTDPKPAGESFEDVVEDTISSASPLEEEREDGGSEQADRGGAAALGDDDAFSA